MASKLHLLVVTKQQDDKCFYSYLGPMALTSVEVEQLQQEFDQYNLFASQLIRGEASSYCYLTVILQYDLWVKNHQIKGFDSITNNQVNNLKPLNFTILPQNDSKYDKLLYNQSDITVNTFIKILTAPFDLSTYNMGYGLLPTTMIIVNRLSK